MKKLLISLLGIALLVGCNKSTEGNKNVVSEETGANMNEKTDNSTATTPLMKSVNGETSESTSYPYKGLDGSRAKIIFDNTKQGKTMSIESGNGKKFELDKKSDGMYERNGIKAVVKGDSLFIIQGENTIPLVLDK